MSVFTDKRVSRVFFENVVSGRGAAASSGSRNKREEVPIARWPPEMSKEQKKEKAAKAAFLRKQNAEWVKPHIDKFVHILVDGEALRGKIVGGKRGNWVVDTYDSNNEIIDTYNNVTKKDIDDGYTAHIKGIRVNFRHKQSENAILDINCAELSEDIKQIIWDVTDYEKDSKEYWQYIEQSDLKTLLKGPITHKCIKNIIRQVIGTKSGWQHWKDWWNLDDDAKDNLADDIARDIYRSIYTGESLE